MLDLAASIANDFETVVDGLRSITLRTDKTVVLAGLSAELRSSEVRASDGKYLAGDQRFHFQANGLGNARAPRPGDVLTDCEQDFTVLESNRVTLSSRYTAVCRRMSIEGNRTTVSIQKERMSKGSTGAMENTGWDEIAAGVMAWVKPMTRQTQEDVGHRTLKPQYSIYMKLPDGLRPQSNWRIIDAENVAYLVISVSGEQRLDQLAEVTAEEHRWPSQ